MFGNNKEAIDLDKELGDLTKRPSIVEALASANRAVVQMRPAAVTPVQGTPVQGDPLEYTARWMRSLRYEDMMQMATEMHAIKSGDSIDTPEQLAKLLHAWAKVTTEPSSHQD